MRRRHFLLVSGLAVLTTTQTAIAADPLNTDALKSSLTGAGASSMMGMLTSTLGVTQNQAEGGVGSMLKLAQEKLSKGDFDKVAGAIPGATKYLDKAKSLGAFTGSIGNAAGLNAALGKLGGSKVGALLKSALA